MRDTAFFHNSVAKKGGAVVISSGDYNDRPEAEFHRCVMVNNTAGDELPEDPQGEAGAIEVGARATLVLADCVFESNWAGKKV